MAIVLEGGAMPQTQTWRDYVKAVYVDELFCAGGWGNVCDLKKRAATFEHQFIKNHFQHEITEGEAETILAEVLKEGLAEVSEFVCECCAYREHRPEELIKHAVRLKLTEAGYGWMPECVSS